MSAINFLKTKEILNYKNLFTYLKWRKIILKTKHKSLKIYNNNQFFLFVLYFFPFCFFFHFEEKDKKTFIENKTNIYEELHKEEEDDNKVSILTLNKRTISKIKFFKDYSMFSGTFLCVYSRKLESLLHFYEQNQEESGIYILFVKFYNRFVSLDYLFYNCFDLVDSCTAIFDFYRKAISNFIEYLSNKIIRSFFNVLLLNKNAD